MLNNYARVIAEDGDEPFTEEEEEVYSGTKEEEEDVADNNADKPAGNNDEADVLDCV